MSAPSDRKFHETHEWAKQEGELISIGITDVAIERLSDLVFIDLPEAGTELAVGQAYGEVESVKAVSDLYAPVSGEVLEVNESLPDTLEVLSDDPYGRGWVAKIKIVDEADLANLMDHAAYQQQCAEEES